MATIYKYRLTVTHEADAYDVNVQDVAADNYQLTLSLGTIIKGDKGDDGDSAYQVAVNNGFVGTEAEWLESLKGEDGKDGKDGTDAEVTAENITTALGYTPADDADIDAINGLIPAQASPQNQLADKSFVNSSIATSTAEFRGTYPSLAALEDVEADANDYAYVVGQDAAGNTVYNRYKYVAGTGWVFEYALNNSSFTAAEWAAIRSGITQSLVAKLSALPTNAELNTSLGNKVDKVQGKGLSTNDYTDTDKAAVAAIPDELADLQDDATHRLVTDTEKSTWNAKQDTISDLSTIRSGAALGATAIQSETDPTVPHWAKQSTKPSYTASEVGAVPTGQGLPSGGSTGQVLKKASATDYDVEWANESGGGGISTLNIPVIPDLGEYNLGTKAQAATVLGITEAELDALMGGNYDRLVFENAIYADRTEAVHTYQSNVSVSYSYTGGNPLRFVFSTDGVEYFSYAENIVPALSTSIYNDGTSTTKAATPKAVKDYVDDLPLPTSLGLFQFTPTESSSYISLGNAAAAATALSISESQLEMLYEGGYNKVVLRDSVEGKICIGSESLVNSNATGISYEIMSGDVTPHMLEFFYESSTYKYRYYQLQGGGSSDAVLYTAQTLTAAQQAQARENIDALGGDDVEAVAELGIDTVVTEDSDNLITSGGVYNVLGDIATILASI